MKNDEEKPKRLTAEVKKELGPETGPLTDALIAEWFHYKNTPSYSTSPKKPWVENGLTSFLEFLKKNFVLVPKDDAETVGDLLGDFSRGDLSDEESVALDNFRNLLNQ